jgi:DNA-binding MarR family transcriptional regulator
MENGENRSDWRDDPGVAAWAALLRTHVTVLRTLAREVEGQTGLPLSWYDVLLELNAAEGRELRMQHLAERVVLSRTRVSRLVDEMVAAGLVVRRADIADARAVLAGITQAGRAALRHAAPVYLQGIQEHFARHLSVHQLTTIRQSLDTVLAAHGVSPHPS